MEDSIAIGEAFVFQADGEIFFLPYIRTLINRSKNLWDFETAYGYSGPISTTDNSDFIDLAWNSFIRLAKEMGIIAGLIRFNPLLGNDRFCSNKAVNVTHERDTIWMDCKRSLSSVLSDYSKKHLRQLNSLEAKGVRVLSSKDSDDLHIFSKIYLKRMAGIGARSEYHFSSEYFKRILKLGSKIWTVYLAYTPDGKVMGGCLLLFSERFCHYHLSGSLQEYFKYKPNDMLRHTVIKDMLNSKIEAIHFGGGRTNNRDDGLFAFKLKFSKQVCEFKIGRCIVDKINYDATCKEWEKKYPEKQEYADFFLKYRY